MSQAKTAFDTIINLTTVNVQTKCIRKHAEIIHNNTLDIGRKRIIYRSKAIFTCKIGVNFRRRKVKCEI